jgi:amino acid adenylation domain-containing protein
MDTLKNRIDSLDPAQREKLRALLAGGGRSRTPQPAALSRQPCADSALSLPQRRLWLMSQFDTESTAYNIPGAFVLTGPLDEAALSSALHHVAARHDILRTHFYVGADGEPRQRIGASAPLAYGYNAATPPDAGATPADLEAIARGVVETPLDLLNGPAWRAALTRTGAEQHLLTLSFHHIVFDGWSLGLFARELFETYARHLQGGAAQRNAPHAPPLQYTDYVSWQAASFDAPARAREIAFWQDALAGQPAPLELPADRSRPAEQSFAGAMVKRVLPRALLDRVKQLAASESCTPFGVFLAAYQVLLHRYTGAADVTVGTPVSGRSVEAIEALIGVFVNTLPIRVRLGAADSFRDVLQRVRGASLDAFAHATLPFDEIVEAVKPERSAAHHPVFQTLFTYQNAIASMQTGPLGVAYMDVDTGSAKFDLSLDVFEGAHGPTCLFEYNTDLFDRARIERLADHFETLLGAAIDEPDRAISALRWLTDEELDLVCGSVVEPARALPATDFVALFEQRAAQGGEVAAVRSQGESLSYAQLNANANRIARALQARGVLAGQPIGVCLERGPALIEAVLAVLKVGASFVALDPSHPAQRLAFVAADAGVQHVLSNTAQAAAVQGVTAPVLLLDASAHERAGLADHNLGLNIQGAQCAYVVYTSGTTGKPKGVQVTHANVVNAYLGWSEVYGLDSLHAHLQMASFPFDVFCGDLIRALGSGKTLVICPQALFAAPDRLHALIVDEGVDFAEFVPAVFRTLADHLFAAGKRLDAVSVLVVASDTWYVSEYRHYRALLAPQGRLVNSYGMAEATIDSTWFEADGSGSLDDLPDGLLVPVGRPFPNVEVLVLDAQLQALPVGVPGEICVGGLGVSAGYLNRPELDAEKFVPHPFSTGKSRRLYRTGDLGRMRSDGQLELLGRRDTQVKVRGMRIELGEIEMALRDHAAGVADAVVIVRESQRDERQIVAYIVADGDAAPSPAALNQALAEHVPGYMLPSLYVFLDALPLSPNGKLDRGRLPEPEHAASDAARGFVSPRTLTEEMLATVWCQVFRLNRVGVFDSFFALGGHSLLAFQIVARARDAFQVDLPLRTLFASPTIAGLAEAISDLQGRRAEYDATVNALPLIEPDAANQHLPFPMTEVQQAYWLGRNDVFEFGNVTTHSYDEMETTDIDVARFQRAWNKVVARHPMLRAEILPDGTQHILPHVPEYTIRELDLSGLPADAVEQGIEQVRGEMSHQMLDVHRWPVFDVRVTRLANDQARIHFSSDALMFDVWSFVIIIEDLVKFYLDESVVLPTLELSFRDYVIAEESLRNTERHQRALAYWRGRIATLAAAPDLPMAMDPSLLKKPRFTRLHATMEPEAWGRLKLKAVRGGMTATGLMLAAYAEVLAVYSRDPAFSLNLTFLNRHPLHPQVNEIVGEFTSLTMLGVDQTRGASFLERARLIQGDLWNDLEHHDISGVQVLRDLTRAHGGATRAKMPVVFTSALVVPIPKRKEAFPIVPVYRDGVTQTSQVWLDCGVWEDNHVLLCNWDVVLELYPPGLIEEMFDAYWRLVRRLADEDEVWHTPDLALAPTRPLRQRRDAALPELALSGETLDSLFLRSLARNSSATAIVANERQISYAVLGEYAAWVAREVGETARKGELVAVAMDKGWEQVAAVLGIVACGAAYLPIDPALPDERVAAILADAKVRCIVSTPGLRQRLESLAGLAAETALLLVDEHVHAPLETLYALDGPEPDDIAYVIFTSGSTGRPKGVTIDHRGAVNTLLDVNQRYQIGAQDRTLALSSLSFDLSVFDIFGTLAAGGCIVMPQHERRLDPTHWLALMQRHQVTLWNSVPALCGLLLDHAEQTATRLPHVKRILLSGDWIPVGLPERARRLCPSAGVTSLGGATEASVWSVLYDVGEVASQWKSIPYGVAMRNQSIEVLNDRLEPCPDWVVGPIYIGGVGLALGYWGDEAKTAASFVRRPCSGERLYRTGDLGRRLPDGNIEFLGRNDFQVKVQGHRIELGEIESVLLQHPSVRDAVALASGERHAEKRLAAFIVAHAGHEVDLVALRRWLLQRLPEYMVPLALRAIEELPLTANGKVDRSALPAPFETASSRATESVPPRNDAERQVAAIWCEVLGLAGIGVFDDFFAIGGDSMLAIKLLATLRHRLGVDYQLKHIFLNPTVAAQAARLRVDELAAV